MIMPTHLLDGLAQQVDFMHQQIIVMPLQKIDREKNMRPITLR